MSNIKCFPGTGKIDPTALLKMAEGWDMDEVVIIGKNADGDRMWGASSDETRDLLLHLEWAKTRLMREFP